MQQTPPPSGLPLPDAPGASPSRPPHAPTFARLRFTSGSLMGVELELHGALVLLGRSSNCDIRLDDAADTLVSGRHARIMLRDGFHWLEDLHSKNGTFLNGARIGAPALLSTDDEVSLGPVGATGSSTACFLRTAPTGATEGGAPAHRSTGRCPWCLAPQAANGTGPCAACGLPAPRVGSGAPPWDAASAPALLGLLDAVVVSDEIKADPSRADRDAVHAGGSSPLEGLLGLFRRRPEPPTTRDLGEQFVRACDLLLAAAEDAVYRNPRALREANASGEPTVREIFSWVERHWIAGQGPLGGTLMSAARAAARARANLRERATAPLAPRP